MVGVEVEGPAAVDERRVEVAPPSSQIGQAGQGVGRPRLELEGPAEGLLSPIKIVATAKQTALENEQVCVARMSGQGLAEDRLGLVQPSRVGVGPGQQEPDLVVRGLVAEDLEGQRDGLVIGPADKCLPDLVRGLGQSRPDRGQHDRDDQGRRQRGPRAHGFCPALAKPLFSMDPHSFLPLR